MCHASTKLTVLRVDINGSCVNPRWLLQMKNITDDLPTDGVEFVLCVISLLSLLHAVDWHLTVTGIMTDSSLSSVQCHTQLKKPLFPQKCKCQTHKTVQISWIDKSHTLCRLSKHVFFWGGGILQFKQLGIFLPEAFVRNNINRKRCQVISDFIFHASTLCLRKNVTLFIFVIT